MQRRNSRRLSLWKGSKSSQAISKDRSEPVSNGKVKPHHGHGHAINHEDEKSADKNGRPLAREIERRKQATQRLYAAAETYWSALGKKKPLPFELTQSASLQATMTFENVASGCLEMYPGTSDSVQIAAADSANVLAQSKDKLLPIEALGLAMAANANTYVDIEQSGIPPTNKAFHLRSDARYSSLLGYVAAVNLSLGEVQATFTETFSNTILSKLARLQAAIEALHAVEKKAEAARERKEAAERKRDKARLKGESKREIEEEARIATAMHDEAMADLENRMSIFTQTEQTGYGSGDALLKEHLDLHIDLFTKQLEITSAARSALDKAKVAVSEYDNQHKVIASNHSKNALFCGATGPTIVRRRSESASNASVTTSPPQQNAMTKQASPSSSTAQAKGRFSKRLSRVLPFRPATSKDPVPPPVLVMNSNTEPKAKHMDRDSSSVADSPNAQGFSQTRDDLESASRSRSENTATKIGHRIGGALTRSNAERDSRSRPISCVVHDGSSGQATYGAGRLNRTAARIATLKKDSSRAYREVNSPVDDDDLASDSLLNKDQPQHPPHRSIGDATNLRSIGKDGDAAAGEGMVLVTETNPEHFPLLGDDFTGGSQGSRQTEAMRRAKRRSAIANAALAADQDVPLTPQSQLPSSLVAAQWTGASTTSSDGGDPFRDDTHKT